jgi:parallel beta-helix repeat protein
MDANGSGSAITLNADGITLVGFNATNSGSTWECAGIKVISSNNTITGNNASNNGDGVSISDSTNNIIAGNNVSNNSNGGIHLFRSNNNAITENTFVNDGLRVDGSYQNLVEGNIVNGKPLVYLEDVSDYKVEDAGQVILVNCTNITVKNLDLSSTSVGVELWKTKDSKVLNNTVSNNGNGISLFHSNNNTITGNNVSNNSNGGISLWDSCSNNTITGNTFVNSALFVFEPYQNAVKDNTVNGKPLVDRDDVPDRDDVDEAVDNVPDVVDVVLMFRMP